ncbi:MAG TPA: hypothetical protein PKD10_13650 [Paracoccaceae bacterium]|nr:hypothetical protein [Paracoccaceae bacterium]HMO71900.1 hypothetical protein [Paracoccaceae bacterium]
MRIVYHLGVHCTDDERLLRTLLRNRGALSAEGIAVPGPTRYRTLLRDTAKQLRGQPASRDTQAMILDQIMDEDRADRLVLSWENFLGFSQTAVQRNMLYPSGPERMAAFAAIFPEIEHEFHLAIRNPATFLPAIAAKQQAEPADAFLAATDPAQLRWSDLVAGLRRACPDVPVTVWCDEDTPLLWPEVVAAVAGHGPDTAIDGTDDVLVQIMRPEGLARMRAYLAEHPPADAVRRRRVVSAFLDKFALPEAIEQELDLPGQDEGAIARLTEAYDRDVARLMRMDGVNVLVP